MNKGKWSYLLIYIGDKLVIIEKICLGTTVYLIRMGLISRAFTM